MKYDTSPLSIDTAGVDLTTPEQELRFVPEEDHPDSGPISQQTILAPSHETQVGFSTFIEPPPQTNRLDAIKDKLDSPKYKTWAMTALLAAFSAVAGGFAVFWVSSNPPPTTQNQPQTIAAEPVHRERTLSTAPRSEQTAPEPSANTAADDLKVETPEIAAPDPPKPQPEREAKVGAYIVEKPAGRRPLARCSDGTYSFSASKSAACAGRGGVSEWMSGDKPSVGTTPAKQAAYVLGPRGGCYYLDSSNKKIYVEKKYCQ
jgi:Protein of unknown function (DUF3761)